MHFSEHTFDVQVEQIQAALQALLGEDPSREDVVALLNAGRAMLDGLEQVVDQFLATDLATESEPG